MTFSVTNIKPWQADVLLLLIAAIWGATFPIIKDLIVTFPVFLFLALRFDLGLLIVLLFVGKKSIPKTKESLYAGVILGIFLFLGYAFQTLGLLYTSSSKAAFITGLNVILVPFIAYLWIKEPLQKKSIVGILIATSGLFLLNYNGTFHFFGGDLLIFGSAIAFAFHIVAVSRFNKLNFLELVQAQFFTVAALSHLANFISEDNSKVVWTSSIIFVVVFCGIVATGLAFVLQIVLQRATTSTRTALMFSSEPLWGAFFSWLLLKEQLHPVAYAGGSLMIIGILYAELSHSKKSIL